MTLIDTNVLLDLVTNDGTWADWSIEQLEAANLAGPLLINDVVYAELAVRYDRIEELDAFIDEAWSSRRFRGRRCFLPERPSRGIAGPVVLGRVSCRISSSARMLRFSRSRC